MSTHLNTSARRSSRIDRAKTDVHRRRGIRAILVGLITLSATIAVAPVGSSAEAEVEPLVDALEADAVQATIDAQVARDGRVAAAEGLTIGNLPGDGEPLSAAALPDLVPVVDEVGLVGYARADELFVELFDPSLEFVGFGIYEPDGKTLIGVQTAERFVEGDLAESTPTSRKAIVPEGDSPLSE